MMIRAEDMDMSQTIQDKVCQIIAEQAVLDISDITPEASLASLGIDSLGLVESIFAIEEAFDISVPFNSNQPQQSQFAAQQPAQRACWRGLGPIHGRVGHHCPVLTSSAPRFWLPPLQS